MMSNVSTLLASSRFRCHGPSGLLFVLVCACAAAAPGCSTPGGSASGSAPSGEATREPAGPTTATPAGTRGDPSPAHRVVAGVLQAYGGQEALRALRQIIIEYKHTMRQVGQSRKPGPPWDQLESADQHVIDFPGERAARSTQYRASGFNVHRSSIVAAQRRFALNHTDRVVITPTSSGNPFHRLAGAIAVTNSTLVVKLLHQKPESIRYVHRVRLDGRDHHVLEFDVPEFAPVTVFIDAQTHQVRKLQRPQNDDTITEYRYDNHTRVKGLLFPMTCAVRSSEDDGEAAEVLHVKRYRVNEPVDEAVAIPDGYVEIEWPARTQVETIVLNEGVYLVASASHNGNSLFVEFADYILMFGGYFGAAERIAEVRRRIPDKPIRYAVFSHHHDDHIGGARAIYEAGIALVCERSHRPAIVATLPADGRASARFELVDGLRVFEDARQRVEVHDIGPTPHSEHLLIAYLPKHGIVMQADHFFMWSAPGYPIPPRIPASARLFEALRERNMTVTRLVSEHSRRIVTYEQLKASYHSVRR